MRKGHERDLRELTEIASAPSEGNWARLVEWFSPWTNETSASWESAIDCAEASLRDWPDHLRELPLKHALPKLIALPASWPFFRLARSVADYDTYADESFEIGLEGIHALATTDKIRGLTHLYLYGGGLETIGDLGLRSIAQSATFGRLTALYVFANDITGDGVRALAETPHLHNLAELCLAYNPRIGPAGAESLVSTRHLSKLTRLDLWGCHVGDQGAKALVSGSLDGLTGLILFDNELGPEGGRAIARSAHLRELIALDLSANEIGDEGACAISQSRQLPHLESLFLGGNEIGLTGVRAIADSPHFPHLKSLNLGGNPGGTPVADVGVEALSSSPHLTHLTDLYLYQNGIGPNGAKAIAMNPGFCHLRVLDLENNHIGDEGACFLAGSAHLQGLETLNLGNNGIGNAGKNAIRKLPGLRKVEI